MLFLKKQAPFSIGANLIYELIEKENLNQDFFLQKEKYQFNDEILFEERFNLNFSKMSWIDINSSLLSKTDNISDP